MPKITNFLAYNSQAEEAATFYTSIFPRSKIVHIVRSPEGGPGPKGSVLTVAFELDGEPYVAMNGGPAFTFTMGISLCVHCETQAEIDHYWEKLPAGGGQPLECGWLKDKWGLHWQIWPAQLSTWLSHEDPKKSQRVMQAVWTMKKLELATLKRAFDEG